MKVFRVHYDWHVSPGGEIYHDYTVGKTYEIPGEEDENGFPIIDKVTDIEYIKRGRNTRVLGYTVIKTEKGYEIIQDNIQSIFSKPNDNNKQG